MMKLRVEDCTMLKTNKKNYKLEVNDPVEYEAGLNKNGELSLYNLAVWMIDWDYDVNKISRYGSASTPVLVDEST